MLSVGDECEEVEAGRAMRKERIKSNIHDGMCV